MRALVVYESMYGNTRRIADAIGDGLRPMITTDVLPIADVTDRDVNEADLLVVGGPTHAWGMSRRRTREASAQPPKHGTVAPPVAAAAIPTGVREWLRAVSPPAGRRAAAFDTRLAKPAWLTGSAMKSIQRGLVAAGFTIFSRPRSFTVDGSTGPLSDGELERARRWGEEMGQRIVATVMDAPKRAA